MISNQGISVVFAPRGREPEADVIFVHGFTGHPRLTWTLGKAKVEKRQKDEHFDSPRRRPDFLQVLVPSKNRNPQTSQCSSSHTLSRDAQHASATSCLNGTSPPLDRSSFPADGLAIHGDVFWPQDLLPLTITSARIMTYGYDTRVRHVTQGQISQNTLQNHAWNFLCELETRRRSSLEASRPLIFIAHSLGGLVVKEALRLAQVRQASYPHLYNVFEATKGIIFFGTPHRGADPRNLVHRVMSLSALGLGVSVNKEIVESLMPTRGGHISVGLADFRDAAWQRQWVIYSFQEEYGLTYLFNRKVVEDSSSCLELPVLETSQHISSNHMDMCRFFGLDDPGYQKVIAALERIMGTSSNTSSPLGFIENQPSPLITPSVHIRREENTSINNEVYTTRMRQGSLLQIPVANTSLSSMEESLTENQTDEQHSPSVHTSSGTTPMSSPLSDEILGHASTAHKQLGANVSPNCEGDDLVIEVFRERDKEKERQARMEKHKKLIEQLRFDQIGARFMTVRPALAKTCEWVLKSEAYADWQRESIRGSRGRSSGFLWIKGKPGTGKSTLMKFLHSTRLEHRNAIVIAFFFNARGDELEKSSMGCYRALLFQLLNNRPELWKAFERVDELVYDHITRNGWRTVEIITEIFQQAVVSLSKDTPLELFVDALDECEEWEIEHMVSFFEDLGDFAESRGITLRVCFSSRHYPSIVPNKGVEVILENETYHHDDISRYIEANLRLDNSSHSQEIRHALLSKCSAIFLWVVLVIPILNREYARGRMTALRSRLDTIPPGLDSLFKAILTRDQEDIPQLRLCLQWVLFSTRPLSPRELFIAIEYGLNPRGKLGAVWYQQMSDQDLRRYVENCSKGLAEVTASKHPTVQFIHESVRNSLLARASETSLWLSADGLGDTTKIHEYLRDICMDQIKLVPWNSSMSSETEIQEQYPLVQYALNNALCHSEQAHRAGKTQMDFLNKFPIAKWTFLSNCLNGQKFDTEPNILYLLAQFNAYHLIRDYPTTSLHFQQRCGGYGYPWLAALLCRHLEALQELTNATDSSIRLPAEMFQDFIGYLSANAFNIGEFNNGNDIIVYLAAFGHGLLLESFLLQTALYNCQCRYTDPPDGSEGHHSGPVCLKTIHNLVNSQHGSCSRTPLFWAWTEETIHMLIRYGANPNAQDALGITPVHVAVNNDPKHENIVQTFCTMDCIPIKGYEAWDDIHNGPHIADNHIVDIEGCGERGGSFSSLTPLSPPIDFNVQDNDGLTPLHHAIRCRHKLGLSYINALIQTKRVNPRIQDKQGRSPLFYAAQDLCPEAVKILLDAFPQEELDPDTADSEGRTPLRWALEIPVVNISGEALARQLQCAYHLLESGRVDPFRKAKDDLSPFDIIEGWPDHWGKYWSQAAENVRLEWRKLMLEAATAPKRQESRSFSFRRFRRSRG